MKRKRSQKPTAQPRKKRATKNVPQPQEPVKKSPKKYSNAQEPVKKSSIKYSNVNISLVNSQGPVVKRPTRIADLDISIVKPQESVKKARKELWDVDISIVKPQEPVKRQRKKFTNIGLDISIVNFKTPRRNVKPPKKYADEDFIYYNNAGSEEFGIDPAFLCECALDTSDPSVSGDRQHFSEGTVTAASEQGEDTLTVLENGDDIADLSKLCETVLVTSDSVDAAANHHRLPDDSNENLVESEDDFVDMSKMCQTQLITSDPNDPQAQLEIKRLVDGGCPEEEFILGLSDGELDFASSIRPNKKEVYQKKPDEKVVPLSTQNTKKKENTTVPKRKAQRRRKTRRPKSRRKKKKIIKEKEVKANETNIPTKSTAVSVDQARHVDEKVCSQYTLRKKIRVLKPEDKHLKLEEKIVRPENILDKEEHNTNTDKEVNAITDNPRRNDKGSENILDEELPVAKHNSVFTKLDEEKGCPQNVLVEDVPVENTNVDNSGLNEKTVSLEKVLDKETPVEKAYADNFKPYEEKVCLENICDRETPVEKYNAADNSKPYEEKVCLENTFDRETPVEKVNSDVSIESEEKVFLKNIPEKNRLILEEKSNADSNPHEEKVSPENILDKEVPVLNSEASTTNSSKEIGKIDDKPNAMVEEKNVEECSVPDTDSGCDVDMEQGCEEDDHLNLAASGEDDSPVVDQVPYFNETRTVKVLLQRLEDTELFSEWKEGKQLPESAMPASSTLQPTNDGVDQMVSSEIIPSRSKSKKSRRYRRNTWENIKLKRKHVRCTNCNKKFPNEFVMKKHLGSRTCVVTVSCRICKAKFKSIERLLEHKKSNCDTERVFACDVCGKSYALMQYLERHQKVCRSGKSNKCNICNKEFQRRKYLEDHLLVHGPQRPKLKRYLCEICGALSRSKEIFQFHKEQHMENLTIICKRCGEEFKSTRRFRKHMKKHKNNTLQQYTCAECGISFLQMNKLKTHLAVHGMITSLQKFECEICQLIFDNSSSLKLHLQTHSAKKDHVCLKCTVPFTTEEELKEHATDCCGQLSAKKEKEENPPTTEGKPHKCHICGKSFTQMHNLKRHSSVHLEQNPSLICDVCGKKFKSSFHLSQHILMISCDISSTNYFCKECGNQFENFPSLKMHFIEAHNVKSPVKCDKCGKEFEDKKKLRSHSITHSERYWASCNICGKVITQRSLKNHILSHKNSSGSGNIGSEVKVEPVIKVEELPNLSNESGSLSTNHWLSENAKPKLAVNNHNEKNLLPCRFCGKILGSRRSLKRHVLQVHKSSNLNVGATTSSVPKAEPSVVKVEQNTGFEEKNYMDPLVPPISRVEEDTYLQELNYIVPPESGITKVEGKSYLQEVNYIVSPESQITNVDEKTYIQEVNYIVSPESQITNVVEETYMQEANCIVPPTQTPVEEKKQRLPNKTEKNMSCRICGKVLAHSKSLRRHMFSVHKISPNGTTTHVEPKKGGFFNVNNQRQLALENKNAYQLERQFSEVKPIQLQDSGSASNQLPSMSEHQISMHMTRMEIPSGKSNESYESFNCNLNTPPQTEQQVPKASTSISGLSSSRNNYQSSEISDTSILMSQLINAHNYKMYLPNTSFVNSQCQSIEDSSSVESTVKDEDAETHELIMQPPQSQQNHYSLLDNSSDLAPMTYIRHEVPTTDVHSLGIPDSLISKVSGSVEIPQSNQYPNAESIATIHSTSLLEDHRPDIVNNIICTPPPVQTLGSDTITKIPVQETLAPQYVNTQEFNDRIHTEAPSIGYNYFISSGCSDLSETLTNESNLTTQTSLPLCYQSPQVPGMNFKIIQQNVPVTSSTNTYVVHQYMKPEPIQTTSIAHFQSPQLSNDLDTYILIQPESPRTSSSTISRAASSSNQHTKKVDISRVEPYKAECVTRKPHVSCNLCKSCFYSKEDLNKHLIVHGLEVTLTHYRCTTCQQAFDLKYKYRAEEHLRIHTGEKPFSCKLCPQKFRTSGILNKHSLSHSKQSAPTTCSVCQVKLSSTYCLRRHLKSVHKIDTPPTFQPPQPIKKESSVKSTQSYEVISTVPEEQPPVQSEVPVEPLQSIPQPYMSQEICDFRDNHELTTPHSYSYSFAASNGHHSDIALDLRDDFVPDAMETVLKLENW